MNVMLTSFSNPFSFFCIVKNDDKSVQNVDPTEEVCKGRMAVSHDDYGEYVAVKWKNKWVRGIISMDDSFSIWLVDYGMYIRCDEKTVYTKLPPAFKNYPSKVFEASIHGVVPVTQSLSANCQIEHVLDDKWTKAAIVKAKEYISSAVNVYFQPIGMWSTKFNDVVIGDLYLQLCNQKIINIIDVLEICQLFLKRSNEAYITDISRFYTTRRLHRACRLKPVFLNKELPIISQNTTLQEYNAICKNNPPPFESETELDSNSEDGSTVLDVNGAYKKIEKPYKLTAEDIEKYSTMFITIHGRKYNALQVLLNKIRDFNMCEKYKDMKSVGRGCTKHYYNDIP